MTDPIPDEETAIVAGNLRKRFGPTEALRGIDLAVPRGTVCGVLGPNGAGKTTAVRILTTLLVPDAGFARVAGFDVQRDPERVRASIGLAGQQAAVDELLTGRANLELFGRLYHLPAATARRRAEELLDRFALADAADKIAKEYSGGMRRRLDLAASLIADPPVLFLDEPTTGLDPRSRNDLWETIRGLVDNGTTVLLTTQYLEEADRLADRILVIDHGRDIAEGSPAELKASVGGEQIDVVPSDPTRLADAAGALRRAAAAEPVLLPEEGRATVPVAAGAGALAAVVRELDAAGVVVADLALRRPSLDEVFLRLTNQPVAATIDDPAGAETAKEAA